MLEVDRGTQSIGALEEERVILLRLMVGPEQKDLFEAAGLMRQAPLPPVERLERTDAETAPAEYSHRGQPRIRLTDNIPRIDGSHILQLLLDRGFQIDPGRSYFKYFGSTSSDQDLYLVALEFSRNGEGVSAELMEVIEEFLKHPFKDVEIYENRAGRIRESITLRRPVLDHTSFTLKLEFRLFERRWNVPFNGVQACA